MSREAADGLLNLLCGQEIEEAATQLASSLPISPQVRAVIEENLRKADAFMREFSADGNELGVRYVCPRCDGIDIIETPEYICRNCRYGT